LKSKVLLLSEEVLSTIARHRQVDASILSGFIFYVGGTRADSDGYKERKKKD